MPQYKTIAEFGTWLAVGCALAVGVEEARPQRRRDASLRGTYVAVEPFYLDRYVGEQVFRYNSRKNKDDYDRFMLAVSQWNGKRLTLAELTGNAQQQRPF